MEDFIKIEVVKKCVSWKNSIRVSPHPKYKILVEALHEASGNKKLGHTLNYIIKDYFDKLPEPDRIRLIKSRKNHY
jgi:hypothetical protein